LRACPGEIPAENLEDGVCDFVDRVRVDQNLRDLDLGLEIEQRPLQFCGPRFEDLLRADELFIGALPRETNAICGLQRNGAK
jgi:hypothetical protein